MTVFTQARYSKLLFLDFDGVLHPTSAIDAQLFCRMSVLLQAVNGLECGLVISSSWRHHHRPAEIVAHFPDTLQQRIVGFTGDTHIGRWPRFQEIRNYLGAFNRCDWRALDDSFLEFPPGFPKLLLCNPNIGIEARHTKEIRQWLMQ